MFFVLICGMQAARAQSQPDTTTDGAKARQQYLTSKGKTFGNTISASSKENFWDFVGQVGSVLDNTSTGITLDPTLDKFKFLGKAAWLKNVQLNGTPTTKGSQVFKYDSLSVGVTWAIINNYTDPAWRHLAMGDIVQRYLGLNQILLHSALVVTFKDAQERATALAARQGISKKVNSTMKAEDLKDLPTVCKLYILSQLETLKGTLPDTITRTKIFSALLTGDKKHRNYRHLTQTELAALPATEVDGIILAEFNNAYIAVNSALKKKTQLNFAVNSYDNFVTHRWQGIYFTPNFTDYWGGKRQWSYTIKAAYSFEVDTLHPTQGFSRQLLKLTPSLDWLTGWMNPDYSQLSFLELKASAEIDRVFTGHYPKAKPTPVSPAVTVTLNLTDKFSIPISIKYDDNKSSLFGFLTVQYALGGSKADANKASSK